MSLLVFLPAFIFSQTIQPAGNQSFCGSGTLTVQGASPGTTFQWQEGGTDLPGQTNPSITITTNGTYRVILTTGTEKDTLGPVHVTVNNIPSPNFTFVPNTAVCMNNPVQFTYTGTTGVSFQWDFGDPNSGSSNTSNAANPSHVFIGSPGNGTQTFTVTLTVRTPQGCEATTTRTITLNQRPDMDMNGNGKVTYNGQVYFRNCSQTSAVFNFTNNSSTAATNTHYQIVWGNGAPDYNAPTFNTALQQTYSTGLYTMLFIVTNGNGCKDTATYRVFVGSNPAIGFATPGNTTICNDESLTFIISNFDLNPPATQYTVIFNDGTDPIQFNHPPPTQVDHQFNLTSCGTVSGAYNNSFSATIEASNACSRSTVQVVPIYVSEKPIPDFTISPKDTVCTNQTVTLTNSSNSASYNDNGVCAPGNFIWKITPSTGFTVVSGSLGEDYGSTDSEIWQSGTPTLQLQFQNSGSYEIKLLVGNPKCGNDSITKIICVNDVPTGTFTLPSTEGCAPLQLQTSLTTNTGNCTPNTFLWNVGYNSTSGCTPSTSEYTFIGGTNAQSMQPQIRFVNPGIYTLTPRIIAANGACYVDLPSQQVLVKSKPVVNINGIPASICTNQSIAPTALATCHIDANSTYAWTFGGATPTNSTAASPGNITFNTPGNQPISLAVTNSCGTTTVNTNVTVNPTPEIDAIAPINLCNGNSQSAINIITNPPNGVSVTWTNNTPSIGLSSSGSFQIPAFTAVNNGSTPVTATINITASIGSCQATTTTQITVAPSPAAPAAPPVNYCVGETATPLTAVALTGHTLMWYTQATGGTGSTTAPTPSTASAGTTTYYVSQVNDNTQCESVRTPVTVTLTAVPSIAQATGTDPNQCSAANGSIRLTGLSPNTSYAVHYTGPNGAQSVSLTSDNSGVINITNLPAGAYSNIYVVLNNCASQPVGPVSLSDPAAPSAPTANNNGPVCAGQTLTLTATSVAGATYQWTGPNGFTANTATVNIPNATTSHSGAYSVAVTLNGCTSPAATTNVVVNETPVITSVNANSPVCSGTSIQLQSQVQYTSGTLTYAWTGPNGFTDNTQNPTIPNAQTINAGTYQLTVTGDQGNCPSTPLSVAVIVNPTPEIGTISGSSPTQCSAANGSISISGLANNLTYVVRYTKNGAAQSATLTTNGSGTLTIPNLTAGVYSDFEVDYEGCLDNDNSTITLIDPNPPATPVVNVADAEICSGNSISLSTPNVANATYQWSGPNGFTSTSQNPTIPNAQVVNGGNYQLTITVDGCTSAAGQASVTVNQTPDAPVLSSNSPICNNNTLQFESQINFPGSVSYSWTGPNGFTANTANPSIPNAQSIHSGNYQLVIYNVNGNCPSPSASIPVTVHTTPVITSGMPHHPIECSTPTGSIVLAGLLPNTNYQVNYEFGGTPVQVSLTSNGSGELTIPNLTAGNYTNISVSLNSCTSNVVGPFALQDPNPPAPPILQYGGPICSLETLQISASTNEPGTPSYSWTGPDGFSSTLAQPQIPNATVANSGTYYATVTINNCTSNAASLDVVVHPLPDAPTVNTPVHFCIDVPATALTATPTNSNTLQWYENATSTTPLPSAPIPSTTSLGSTDYYVAQTNQFGCQGPRTVITAQVNPDAQAMFNPPSLIGCPPFVLDNQAIGLQTFPDKNGDYNWYADGIFIGSGINFPGYTITNANDSVVIKLVTTALYGCKSDSMEVKFHTYKVPQPQFTMSTNNGCGPLEVTFTNQTPDIDLYQYQWTFGNGITSTQAQPGSIIFNPNPQSGDTIYNVILEVNSVCQSLTTTQSVLVKSIPIAHFTPDRSVGCSPMVVTFNNTSRGNDVTYHWDYGDGQSLTTTQNTPVTHTYHTGVVDTFTVRLIAENECGSDTTYFDVIAAPNNINLNFQMNGPDQFGCAPHTVPFINNTPGGSVFHWDFGDGNVLSTTAPHDTVYHTFNNPGVYTITLLAQNACTDTSATRTITVYAKPLAQFTPDRVTVCIGESIQFSNTSSGATTYSWNFGDGSSSSLVNPSHAYSSAGTYTVKLYSSNTNAPGVICVDSALVNIEVVSQLPGSFTITSNGSCAPLSVTFTNDIAHANQTSWDFGDGTTGTGHQVTHTYNNVGVYTVTMTATSLGGCTYQSTQTVRVTGVSGSWTYQSGFICEDVPVRFEVTGTNIQTLNWDLGDGTTLTNNQQILHHQYLFPGTYVPSVVLQSADGCTYTLQGVDTIKVDRMDVGYTYNIQQLCGSTIIQFNDTSSVFFGKQSVTWDFGDGTSGSGENISHTYLTPGTYTVEMVVTGNSGCVERVVKQITVSINSIPSVQIDALPQGCTQNEVRFLGVVQSTDPITFLQWNVSNGATGQGMSFDYTFTQTGNYTVRFIAGTDAGCFDTTTHQINILPSPTIRASQDVTYCLGGSAVLNATGADNFQWSPVNDLSCTNCASPTTTATVTTPYVVMGTAPNGCTGRDTVVVTVIQPFELTVSPNDSICIGSSTRLNASGAASYVWTPANSLDNNRVPNPLATPNATTTYRVIGYDGHSCFTDTAFVTVAVGMQPTVNLGPDLQLSAGTEHPLVAQVTNGPVAIWNWSPADDLDCADCPQPTAYIRNNITYTVHITTAYGCEATDEVNIKVFCTDAQVFIPNAFTPDGDGINDILMVRGKGIARVKTFRIFNRWGEVVFERSNFSPNDPTNGWDGRVRGKLATPDVFVYTAEVICENGTTYTYKGNVSLLK